MLRLSTGMSFEPLSAAGSGRGRSVVMAATGDVESFVDLVCEGGGVKGIGLAGAYSMLEEQGWKPQNVAGTSAGAITAAVIAAGYTSAEVREITFGLDYRRFEDRSWQD